MDVQIKVGVDTAGATKGLQDVKAGVTNLKTALVPLESEFEKVNKELQATQKYLPGYTSRIAELKNKLAQLTPAQNSATSAIEKTAIASQKAEVASGGFAKGLGKAFSGLRNIANVIPGIGIGGLVGLLAGPLVDALEDVFSTSEKAGDSLAKTFSESGASVAGNVARLQALVSIAKDVTKSDGERKQALGALNKEYDIFNGKLTLSNINTKAATDLIDKQTLALVRQAQIKGLQDLITKETEKQAEIAGRHLSEQLGGLAKLRNLFASIISPTIGQTDAIVQGLDARDEALKESGDNIDFYQGKLKELLGAEAKAGTLFQGKPIKVPEVKLKPFKLTVFKPDDPSKVFFDEANVKLAVPAFVELDFKKGLRGDPFKSEGLTGIMGPEVLRELQMQGTLLGLGISTGIQDGIETGVTGLRFPELRELYESAVQRIDEFNRNVADVVKNTTTALFENIGESLGKALSGGFNASDIFGGIFNIIADGLKAFGKALIGYGVALKVLKTAIKNPTTAIIAGIGLIAAGTLLENALPQFAQGVENFGGGLAVVGERGPELVRLPSGSDVIPNHRLGGIGSSSNIFIPDIKIRGNDLLVVFNRAQATSGRNG